MSAPLCVAVHGVFAEGAAETLAEAGVSTIVTCNTVAHDSNAIDISTLSADAIVELSSFQTGSVRRNIRRAASLPRSLGDNRGGDAAPSNRYF